MGHNTYIYIKNFDQLYLSKQKEHSVKSSSQTPTNFKIFLFSKMVIESTTVAFKGKRCGAAP